MAKHPVKENSEDALGDIARKIVQEREKRNLNQRELADLVGTTQTSIRRLEKGETNAAAVLLVRVAKALVEKMKCEKCEEGKQCMECKERQERAENEYLVDLLKPIQPEEQLVNEKHAQNAEAIKKATSGMGLSENDTDDFYTKRDLLRLMKLWPR